MRGSKKEISPGVWKLRVYAGRRPNGTPIQISKTVHAPERKLGAGARLADRELAKLVSDVSVGKVSAGRETVGTLLHLWLNHCESIGHSPDDHAQVPPASRSGGAARARICASLEAHGPTARQPLFEAHGPREQTADGSTSP